jgi:transcriptional regulator with XRE-family HTH domain
LLHFLHVVREDRRLTRSQLAASIGSYRAFITRLENGEAPNNPTTIAKLAAALSVPLDVLTADAITIRRDGRIEVAR